MLIQAETRPLFFISQRTELGLMSEIFLGPAGIYFFYFIMIVYLFGDLTIYAVSVPLTMVRQRRRW